MRDPTPATVAEWMAKQIDAEGYLDRQAAVDDIAERFGDEFTYLNDNGNLAIDREVLKEFRRLTEAIVVWDRAAREWRKRKPDDEPGRQQW